jgi:integrase
MPFRPKNSRYWHYDFQIRGCRFHGSCETEDYEQAKSVEAQARVNAKEKANAPAGVFTLSEAIGTYFNDICQHQPSARTAISHGKNLVALIDPKTKLPEMTMAMVQKFVSQRRAKVANGTVNRDLQFLGRAIKHMVKVHRAIAPDLDLSSLETKEAEERVRELTPTEQAALFENLRSDLQPLVLFALMTGGRLSELCALQWPAVDLDAGVIRFRQKGGTTRRFPINSELRAFLSSLPRANSLPHSRYVLTYLNHKDQAKAVKPRHKITPSGGIMATIKSAMTDAGIEDFRFHDLRHTFATRLLRHTGNLKLVSRLLGHTQIETTMRYAHVLDGDMRDGLDGYAVLSRVPKLSPKTAEN